MSQGLLPLRRILRQHLRNGRNGALLIEQYREEKAAYQESAA